MFHFHLLLEVETVSIKDIPVKKNSNKTASSFTSFFLSLNNALIKKAKREPKDGPIFEGLIQ